MPSPGTEDNCHHCKKMVELQGSSFIPWLETVWCRSPDVAGGFLVLMLLPLGKMPAVSHRPARHCCKEPGPIDLVTFLKGCYWGHKALSSPGSWAVCGASQGSSCQAELVSRPPLPHHLSCELAHVHWCLVALQTTRSGCKQLQHAHASKWPLWKNIIRHRGGKGGDRSANGFTRRPTFLLLSVFVCVVPKRL